MTYTFFDKHQTDNLKRFLEKFPESEFWRFFVERNRYNYARYIYDLLTDFIEKQPKPIQDQYTENMKMADLYELAKEDKEIIKILDDALQLSDRKEEKVFDVIDYQIAWLGFEEIEPGYLVQITNGLQRVLFAVVNKEKLSLDFIKELHKISTDNVKNMLNQNPGEFRERAAHWLMNRDTKAGLIETFNYLKSLESKFKNIPFSINKLVDGEFNLIVNTFTADSEFLAEQIFELFNQDEEIYFIAEEVDIDNLEMLCELQITELEQELNLANNKEKKLRAIFSYLKKSVLFHPFQDGVGRTLSMLLLQFLLLSENLLPMLIKDSNVIPGYSVEELIQEYYQAEAEMELIFNNPAFINSEKFAEDNVDTPYLLARLQKHQQDHFDFCLKIYSDTKHLCLTGIEFNSLDPNTF